MARDTALLKSRDQAIRKDFDRMRSARVDGKRKYTAEYIIWQLSQGYYLSEKTIERVVYGGR